LARPRLLDLFCGAGGAAMGYHRAGFDVTGVDVKAQPRYPFHFWQLDALTLEPWVLMAFDAIHASPPCQAYSRLRSVHKRDYPDLIPAARRLLLDAGRPYVIENVPGAPLLEPVMLCGGALGLRSGSYYLRRHRLFECSFPLMVPPCVHDGSQALGVYGHGGTSAKQRGRSATVEQAREAMEMPWASKAELNEAIPPVYTQLIGYQLALYL
jgi:DNA (cytosine-5)-methyltransferase 1